MSELLIILFVLFVIAIVVGVLVLQYKKKSPYKAVEATEMEAMMQPPIPTVETNLSEAQPEGQGEPLIQLE